VFVRTSPGRIDYYRPSSVSTVMWMLSQYAAAAGHDLTAAKWLARVSSLTDPTRLRLVEAMIGRDMIPGLITAGKYSEAVDAALRYGHATHLFTRSQIRNQDEMERGVDLAESWNPCNGGSRTDRGACSIPSQSYPRRSGLGG